MRKRERRSRVKKRLAKWRTYCWFPITKLAAGPATTSKFAGIPVLRKGEDWPRCGQCKAPMPLFVQLNLEELPPGSKARKDTKGVVQLFFCTNCRCDTSDHAKKPAFLARLLKEQDLANFAPARKKPATTVCPEKIIVGWRRQEDYPPFEAGIDMTDAELRAFWSYYDRKNGFPKRGDKLLGWANWIQDENFPSCPVCGEQMFCNLFQVASEDNLPFMFGDAGNGWIFLCTKHPDQVTFRWDCY